jgi:hypothetical protein
VGGWQLDQEREQQEREQQAAHRLNGMPAGEQALRPGLPQPIKA